MRSQLLGLENLELPFGKEGSPTYHLGSGSFASCFATRRSDLVVRLTRDGDEIDFVREVLRSGRNDLRGIPQIHYLQELDEGRAVVWAERVQSTQIVWSSMHAEEARWTLNVERRLAMIVAHGADRFYIRPVCDTLRAMEQTEQLGKTLRALHDEGWRFRDLWMKNLGWAKRDERDQLVVMDLGCFFRCSE